MDIETGLYNMTLTRVFDAPVERVWAAWADPRLVKQWWGPHGFTAPVADMDFREGGRSLVCMRTPGGQDLYNTWTYGKIVPMQRIEFVQHFSDRDGNPLDPASLGLPPGIPPEVPHVLTFHSLAGGKTEMAVTEYGYPSEEVVAMSRAGMEQCLDKMAASLASPNDARPPADRPQESPSNVPASPEMRLEVVPLPVADVDRARDFYAQKVGFHLDFDSRPSEGVRVVQLTPAGSGCSVVIGVGLGDIDTMLPGTVKGLHLVVQDVAQVRALLLSRGVQVSEIVEYPRGIKFAYFSDPDGNSWALQEIPPGL